MASRTRRSINRTKSDAIGRILTVMTKRGIIDPPEDIHNEIVKRTHEICRVLDSKAPPNQSLCAGDSPEARGAIALEFVLRKGFMTKDGYEFIGDVPLDILGKEVGCRKADIENLANVARRFLEDTNRKGNAPVVQSNNTGVGGNRKGTGSNRILKLLAKKQGIISVSAKPKAKTVEKVYNDKPSEKLQKQLDAGRVAKKARKANTGVGVGFNLNKNDGKTIEPVRPIHIHGLSIKLQSKLHDPNACDKAATTLFLQLFKYMISDAVTKTFRRKQNKRQDIADNLELYEACCFFIASKEKEQGSFDLKDLNLMKKQQQETGRNANGNNKEISQNSKSLSLMDTEEEERNGEVLMIEDVAKLLKETPTVVSKFLKDVFPDIGRMRAARKKEMIQRNEKQIPLAHPTIRSTRTTKTTKRHINTPAIQVQQTRLDFIKNIVRNKNSEEEKERSDVTPVHPTPDSTVPLVVSPPNNCGALYQNKDIFEKWQNSLFQELEQNGETREDVINRHFVDIMNKFKN